METAEQSTRQFTEENDVLKQFMELLNQQNMGEQSQDFMELFKYAASPCGDGGGVAGCQTAA